MTHAANAKTETRTLTTGAGEYIILDQIGKGGMGQVWSANFVKGDIYSACVIKILHGALALTDDARERFLNEARIACQLDHPNIVGATDMGMLGDAPFIVMDRVDGVDLRKFQAAVGEPLDFDISLYIVGQMLDALRYAHDRTIGGRDAGVVHSDLTPGNIMISSSGEVKLTDFGIARFAHIDGTRTRPIGTPRYMSAEQRTGKTPRATDIFSLGVIYWELLNGSRYLEDHDDQRFTQAILNGYIPPMTRPGVPEWAASLCRQMLADRVEDRPRARDARAIILAKTPHYMLAAQKLEDMYKKFVGVKRSGMTNLLNTADFFGRATPASSPVKFEFESAFSAPSAPASDRTVADSGDVDAPLAFRRSRSPSDPSNELSPNDGPRVTGETGTESPMMLARERAWGKESPVPSSEPALPPMLVHEPAPEPLRSPAPGNGWGPPPEPLLVFEATKIDPPETEPTILLEPPAFVEAPAQAQPPSQASVPEPAHRLVSESAPVVSSGFQAAPVTELRRRTAALWAVTAAIGVLIIVLAVRVVMLLTADSNGVAASTKLDTDKTPVIELDPTSPAPAQVGPPVEPPQAKPPPIEPRLVEVVPEVSTEDPTQPEQEEAKADPELEPVEPEESDSVDEEKNTKPKSKPTPKPPAPRMDIVFLIPGGAKAEIEIDKTKIKGRTIANTRLRPNTYSVRWRTLPDGEWHSVGKLTVQELPTDKGYQVRLTPSNMSVSTARRGSK